MDGPAARRVLRGNVGDFRKIVKLVLCLQRIGQPDVGLVPTFLSDPPIQHVGEANGQPEETELARADQKHHFVRIVGLENRNPTLENYLKVLRKFKELDSAADSVVDQNLTKWKLNVDNSVDLFPGLYSMQHQ